MAMTRTAWLGRLEAPATPSVVSAGGVEQHTSAGTRGGLEPA